MNSINDPRPGTSVLSGAPKPKGFYRHRMVDWARRHRGAIIFLWLPTLLTTAYYLVFAADLYATEAKFVVRSPPRLQAPSLTTLLQGGNAAKAQDDIYSVNDYVVSRDAIDKLESRLKLREMFGAPNGDYLARYPGPLYDETKEDFYLYYQKRVAVEYDVTTGITTVTVKAFRPADAKLIANLLIEESEALVNRLNERARSNAINDAESYVKVAETRAVEAQASVLGYRNKESLLDPGKSSGAVLETIARLQTELTTALTRVAELQRISPDSPLKSGLQTRIDALRQQIQSQQSRLTGLDSSIAPKIPKYEQLTFQQDFALKALASAMSSVEVAREEARRQQIYLDRVVEPSLPDKAVYPKRLKSILTIFISCLLAYTAARLLLAGIREHSQA